MSGSTKKEPCRWLQYPSSPPLTRHRLLLPGVRSNALEAQKNNQNDMKIKKVQETRRVLISKLTLEKVKALFVVYKLKTFQFTKKTSVINTSLMASMNIHRTMLDQEAVP